MIDPDLLETEEYQKFEKEVIEAIGNRISKDPKAKQDFTVEIYHEMFSALKVGEETKSFNTTHNRMLEKAKAAAEAVKIYHDEVLKLRDEYTDSRMFIGYFGTHIKNDCFIDDVAAYFDTIYLGLSKMQMEKGKKGKDNTKTLVVAAYIAYNYKKYFNKKPCTGEGKKDPYTEETNDLPYDRICNVVEKTLGIKIKYHTRKGAIEIFPTWYN